ncbi:MAG: dockerin type I repeat-containing protein, partial [candidate division Zixibacteria bacterium]|nr:dockerin type I repeat-containing protein [candidate division Zixibacteria bacterium]
VYTGPANVPSEQKQGGDDVGSATVIDAVPYYNTGTTAGYTNDYDEVCPYTGSTAPDVVYSFAPDADIVVDISLCDSDYDTKLYLYENTVTPGDPFACNDDACPGYRSALWELQLYGGNTYYIVVDGYGTDYGDYVIDMTEYFEPDPFECPPGAGYEVELCGEDLNGGCNMSTPAFQPIECGDTVCGWIWADGGTRDTDWYTVEFFVETEVTFSGSANFTFVIGFVDTSDCALASSLDPYATGNPDDVVSVTRTCGPGVYWVFVSHQDYYDHPCGTNNDYWCALDCPEGPVLWLSAAPETGTVPGGGTLPITVNYDATELTNGVYSADLKIMHDGRGDTLVPCQITIGDVVPPDTLVLVPDPISSMMENDIEGVDPNGYIYIGDDLGWVDPVVTTVGNGRATIPCTSEPIGYYPGLTPPILKLTFDLSDFAAMYNEGLMWDCDTRSYTVTGTDDGEPISAGDDFTYCGHTSGDLNLDGQIDISDLVMMVEWMFAGGPAPEVLLTADIDGNGEIDISDLVAFVDYMFNNGTPPAYQ